MAFGKIGRAIKKRMMRHKIKKAARRFGKGALAGGTFIAGTATGETIGNVAGSKIINRPKKKEPKPGSKAFSKGRK